MSAAPLAPTAASSRAMARIGAAARSSWRSAVPLALGLGLLLLGCAEAPVVPPAASVPPVPAGAAIQAPAAQAAAGGPLEERARRTGGELEASGRWGEAAAQWEIVSMLRPADGEASRRAALARGRARDEARARSAAAALARSRGDLDTATRGYLLALAAEPDNAAAARALREIELERTRRGQLARGNRTAALEPAARGAAGRPPAVGGNGAGAGSGSPAAVSAQARADAGNVTANDGNGEVRALDEGITAFRRGEYERAIELLQTFLRRHPADAEARGYLRDAQAELARKGERRAPAVK